MFIIEFSGSRFSNQAIPRNGLTNTLSYSQSKPQALYHQVPSRRPGALLAMESPEYVYPATARQPADADHRDHARGNFRVNMLLPCASSVVCGSTPCSGGTISGQRRWKGSAAQSAAGYELPPFTA